MNRWAFNWLGLIVVTLVLCGCRSNSPPEIESIAKELVALDIGIGHFRRVGVESAFMPANSYRESVVFSIGERAPEGRIYICADRYGCSMVVDTLNVVRPFSMGAYHTRGPYLYRSRSGLVVVTLDGRVQSGTAAKIEAVIKRY